MIKAMYRRDRNGKMMYEYRLEKGDVVVFRGKKYEIEKINPGSGYFDFEEDANKWGGFFGIEFWDTMGVLHNWKQRWDGGDVLPKRIKFV